MSLLVFEKIAERRIAEAEERGEFQGLAGSGKPLKLSDDSNLPPELRMAYKVLKNAGYTPPELDLRNQIVQVEDMLAQAPDEQSRYKALKRLNVLVMKLDAIRPQSARLQEHRYASKVLDRISKKTGSTK